MRLLAPITLVGLTTLSVLICTIAATPAARQGRMRVGVLEIGAVEIELAVVEERDVGGGKAADLGDQLAADGAAGAGHQDSAAGDQPRDGVAGEPRLRPAEQILGRHRADVELLGGAVAELDEAG